VVAIPIRFKRSEDDEHPEFVGCLAFDTPVGYHESTDTLSNHIIPTLLAGAGRLAEVLKSAE
jgi:hypothetical protein